MVVARRNSGAAFRRVSLLFVSAACCLLASWATPAANAQLPATADSFVNSSDPTTNYGTSPVLAVGPTSETFLAFNLASLPPGATVQKATLVLFVDSVTDPGEFDVFAADGSWGELTLTYANRLDTTRAQRKWSILLRRRCNNTSWLT